MAEVIVGYTTLKNKLHIATAIKTRPNCGQGTMTSEGFIWSESHPTTSIIAIERAYKHTLNGSYDYCKRCFPWHVEEAN